GEDNEELRMSLRSLANLPHRRVFIVGHTPRWVRGVTSIPGNLRQGASGWRHGWDNVRLIADYDGDMTDTVVVMNDDFVVMEPIEDLPLYYRGPLEQHIDILSGADMWSESVF